MTPQALQTRIANGEYTRHHSDINQLRYGVSRLRNPLLAGHAFHILPYQGLGTGIPRAAQAWGNIELQDNPAANQFKATVQRDVASVDPSGAVNEGVSEGVSEGVNEGPKNLLRLIAQQPGLRAPVLAQALNTSPKNVERWLRQLRQTGAIEFRGAPKTGGYYLQNMKGPAP